MLVMFTVVAGGLVITNIVAAQMDDLNLATNIAVRNVYRLTDINKELLVTNRQVDTLVEDWDAHFESFDRSLMMLSDHPAMRYVPSQLLSSLERTQAVWARSRDRFVQARRELEEIIQEDTVPPFRKRGLLSFNQYLVETGGHGRLQFQVSQLITELRAFDVAARDLVEGNLLSVADEIEIRAQEVRTFFQRILAGAGSLAVVLALAYAIIFTRRLTARVSEMDQAMTRVAERDVTVRAGVTGTDELAGLAANLNQILSVIQDFVISVRDAVKKADELKDALASGTAESASALHQISQNIASITGEFDKLNTGIEQSTRAVTDIDHRVQALRESIERQSELVRRSSTSIDEMNGSIHEVTRLSQDRRDTAEQLVQVILNGGEQIENTSATIDDVTAEIDDILEIIEIINAVAEQTNLLSMNAAIESAHAGEAGKGFAVVAEEIRKLAESTSENASKIDALLKSITGKIRNAREASRAGASTFETINRDVELFRNAMSDISASMQQLSQGSSAIVETTREISGITDTVHESAGTIADNTREISSVMDQAGSMSGTIAGGMSEIDNGAREILNSLTDISSLSDESRERMQVLAELVETFHVDQAESARSTAAPEAEETGVAPVIAEEKTS